MPDGTQRCALRLRSHQEDALAANLAAFKGGARRVTNVMACGTGKTFVGVATVAALAPRRTLCLFPSLALIEQTLAAWRSVGANDRIGAECSDESVDRAVRDGSISCVTNDPASIAKAVRSGRTIFATYQSSALLAGLRFDFGLFDEAHKTVGRIDKAFSFAVDDSNVRIRQRLFMTATPRNTSSGFSMDDEDVYGKVAYRLPFSEAKRRGIICGYRVILLGVHNEEMHGAPENPEAIAATALRKAIRDLGVKKIVTFHGRTDEARAFSENCDVPGAAAFYFDGAQSAAERADLRQRFEQAPLGVASNARVLTEGVDIPSIDMVVFVRPKQSTIDISQAVGRVMRPSPGKECGYVLIPVFVPPGSRQNDAEILRGSRYSHVWTIVSALQEHDDALDVRVRDQGRLLGERRDITASRERISDFIGTSASRAAST